MGDIDGDSEEHPFGNGGVHRVDKSDHAVSVQPAQSFREIRLDHRRVRQQSLQSVHRPIHQHRPRHSHHQHEAHRPGLPRLSYQRESGRPIHRLQRLLVPRHRSHSLAHHDHQHSLSAHCHSYHGLDSQSAKVSRSHLLFRQGKDPPKKTVRLPKSLFRPRVHH